MKLLKSQILLIFSMTYWTWGVSRPEPELLALMLQNQPLDLKQSALIFAEDSSPNYLTKLSNKLMENNLFPKGTTEYQSTF